VQRRREASLSLLENHFCKALLEPVISPFDFGHLLNGSSPIPHLAPPAPANFPIDMRSVPVLNLALTQQLVFHCVIAGAASPGLACG
jgi:hypothetical protein